MLATKNRRGFLRLLVAAPAAVPVIAKEAAAKLGLGGALGGAMSVAGPVPPSYGSLSSTESWSRQMLRVFTRRSQQRQRKMNAREMARRLDPDLASMRSISPSAAYRIQVARCERWQDVDWKAQLQEQVEDETLEKIGLA